MYLLDTNHCSYILQGRPGIIARLGQLDRALLSTSVIVRGELIFMAEKSDQHAGNLVRVNDFMQGFVVFPISGDTADIYGKLKTAVLKHFGPSERTKLRNTTITKLGFDENDIWIAATAIQHDLVVVSADSDFIRMGEALSFSLESW